MIKRTILVVSLLPIGAASALAPPIRCMIATHNWCIAQIYGTLDMKDEGERRRWLLELHDLADAPPLTIVDEKACDLDAPFHPQLLGQSRGKGADGAEHVVTRYALNDFGCRITFDWPSFAGDVRYQELMNYSILIGPTQDHQLHGLGK